MCALEKYKQKRKFNETTEPRPKVKRGSRLLSFVVQRHAASRLHYDFRLEMNGVLKSWAVPKGPSLNPADKRLAVMVEDHPYDYKDFEGTIPKGNYGAGEVEIWDEGTYEAANKLNAKKDETILLNELAAGSIKIILHGKKLKGEFALVRLKSSDEENAWLLIKHKDQYAVTESYNAEEHTKTNSKVTKAVIAKKAKNNSKNKSSPAEQSTGKSNSVKSRKNFSSYLSNAKKLEKYIRPMLATAHKYPFSSEDWVFEIKWDGYRAIAEVGKEFRFYSRNGLSFADKYPAIIDSLKQQTHEMILDGEIVAYKDGMPSFQALQHFDENHSTIIYHVFDLLYLNGHDTRELSLLQRKELLKEALIESDHLKYCDHVAKEGEAFFKAIEENNLEGMIAKRIDSAYADNVRSSNWLKIKRQQTEDVIIAGYTAPQGARSKFGALILGRYNENNELIYAGHAGTGFTEDTLKKLYDTMQPLIIKTAAFKKIPKTNAPATWIKPELVAEIKYSELTKDNIFRHPVFMGLRQDKSAEEVIIHKEGGGVSTVANKKSTQNKKNTDKKNEYIVKINRKEVKLTNQNKIYWPDAGYTKGDLVDYYNQMSRFILPYLKGRPESLNRFPNGISGDSFYQKDAGDNAADWVATEKILSESNQKYIDYIICNDKPTLLYLANLGCIEMNPWNSTIQKPEHPTYLIIDIDPSEKNTFDDVVEVAMATKQVLDECGAACYCKTSGASGMHVFVPMANKYDYEQVKIFAHLIAIKVVDLLPELTTLERSLSKRDRAKIYVDYLQNRKGQTISSVYSPRPKPGATVSTPLDWKEVKKGLHPSQFTIQSLPERVEKIGDIFKPVLGKGIDLKKCLDRLS